MYDTLQRDGNLTNQPPPPILTNSGESNILNIQFVTIAFFYNIHTIKPNFDPNLIYY